MSDSEMNDRMSEIRNGLQELIDRIDDVSYTLLREAVRETGLRPASDKTLVQARRALEKAARLLDALPTDE